MSELGSSNARTVHTPGTVLPIWRGVEDSSAAVVCSALALHLLTHWGRSARKRKKVTNSWVQCQFLGHCTPGASWSDEWQMVRPWQLVSHNPEGIAQNWKAGSEWNV
jgi:hypothetical protein